MPNIARCIGSSPARDSSRVGKCRQLSVGFHLSFVPTALDFGNPPSRGELIGLLSQEFGQSAFLVGSESIDCGEMVRRIVARWEERRVGKEGGGTGRSRW